jgi:hypothetical protein
MNLSMTWQEKGDFFNTGDYLRSDRMGRFDST